LPAACVASVKNSTLFGVAQRADLADRVERADLVVGPHQRDQDRVGRSACSTARASMRPVLSGSQVGDLEALLLQVLARVEHGLVLGLARDDVRPFSAYISATPLSARLIDSVEPDVNTISLGDAPISARSARARSRPLPPPSSRTGGCGSRRCRILGEVGQHRVEHARSSGRRAW
jgi:hypothetical protein